MAMKKKGSEDGAARKGGLTYSVEDAGGGMTRVRIVDDAGNTHHQGEPKHRGGEDAQREEAVARMVCGNVKDISE